MSTAYERVVVQGHTLNKRTWAMLQQMQDFLGYDLTILQGSYNTSVGASAGTHNGGGAVDLAPADAAHKVWVAREVGFWAWHRQAIPNVWSEHVHMIAAGDKQMSPAARSQGVQFRAHEDGLADHGHDPVPHPTPFVNFHYPPKRVTLSKVLAQISGQKPGGLPDVRAIQQALNIKAGAGLKLDGIYGPQTRGKYAHYSSNHGGDGDGTPGMYTTKRLGLALYNVR